MELPNEIGAALLAKGFSNFVALEMTTEAAIELHTRSPTSAILASDLRRTANQAVRSGLEPFFQEAVMSKSELDPTSLQTEESPVSRPEGKDNFGEGTSHYSKRRRAREARDEGSELSGTRKTTADNALRRVIKDRKNLLAFLHLVHHLVRKDDVRLDSNTFPGFWRLPDIPEELVTRRAVGEFLKVNLSTAVLNSVELSWGLHELIAEYSSEFYHFGFGIELLKNEQHCRAQDLKNNVFSSHWTMRCQR